MTWNNSKDLALRERAQRVIPGYTGMYGHLSTILLPEEFPQYFQRGNGARLWDYDGNEYVDYLCAFGPNLLGYNHPEVEAAARAQAELGDTLTGPGEKMIEAAELFVSLVGHAQWALFCKNGTDATSVAMVTARAHTGRRVILAAQGAYHGAAPWCVPALVSKGTLPEDRAHVVYYEYNNPQSLADAFKAHEGDVAAVFATPFWHETFQDQHLPELEFAKTARKLCDDTGALLVVDEVRAGFRVARDASWSLLGIQPDLTTWGKCFANGYAISAVLGAERFRQAATEIYVTGSFWFGSVAMAAACATLKLIRDTDYLERLQGAGEALRRGLDTQAKAAGFELRQTGPAAMPQVLFGDDPDFRIGYAWTTECVQRGAYLHPYHNMFLSSAHSSKDIEQTLRATSEAFDVIRKKRDSLQPSPRLAPLFAMIAQHEAALAD